MSISWRWVTYLSQWFIMLQNVSLWLYGIWNSNGSKPHSVHLNHIKKIIGTTFIWGGGTFWGKRWVFWLVMAFSQECHRTLDMINICEEENLFEIIRYPHVDELRCKLQKKCGHHKVHCILWNVPLLCDTFSLVC